MLSKNRKRKGTPSLAKFHLVVDHVTHRRTARIGKDRSTAACTRAGFHPPPEPAAPLPVRDERGYLVGNVVAASVGQSVAPQDGLDRDVVVLGADLHMVHREAAVVPRLLAGKHRGPPGPPAI